MKDNVNHPAHYVAGKVECIDAIEAATVNKKGIEAVCTANIIKYLWRYEQKNGIEDVKKAKWYLERLERAIIEKMPFGYCDHTGVLISNGICGGCGKQIHD